MSAARTSKAPDAVRFPGGRPAWAWLCVLALLSSSCSGAIAAPVAAVRALDMVVAALANRAGLTDLAITVFHRSDRGWAIYAPLVGHEIDAGRGADTPAFARALAVWQTARGLGRAGVMDAPTFAAMNAAWLQRRPFVAASRHLCPASPPEAGLVPVPAAQSYGGKSLRLRPAALAAYQRMLAAARAEAPGLNADSRLLTVFSAYRDPRADAARCVRDGDCHGVTRATCSAHATGLAIDLFLGAAPGFGPDATDDINRLALSGGDAYRWMVDNAGRFGFVPYAFEPWHWEWTGEPI